MIIIKSQSIIISSKFPVPCWSTSTWYQPYQESNLSSCSIFVANYSRARLAWNQWYRWFDRYDSWQLSHYLVCIAIIRSTLCLRWLMSLVFIGLIACNICWQCGHCAGSTYATITDDGSMNIIEIGYLAVFIGRTEKLVFIQTVSIDICGDNLLGKERSDHMVNRRILLQTLVLLQRPQLSLSLRIPRM